jgi:hypothetical protein
MNIEHRQSTNLLLDFNELEGQRLWGFLNMKEEELFPTTPFLDSFPFADDPPTITSENAVLMS